MSNHYDPWMHAFHLFLSRVLQFVLLTLVFGLAWWAGLLCVAFHVELVDVPRQTWLVVMHEDVMPRAILGQSLVIGALMTGWLFTWLRARARLRRGDRHHRGTRVVYDDDHDEA